MGFGQVREVARFTLLEALRTRLPWLALAVVLLGALLAELAAGLALSDARGYRLEVYAAWTRLALVACVCLAVATSVAREFGARGIDLLLSRPVSRGAWFAGRLLGHGTAAVLVALAASLPLYLDAAPAGALAWGLSLALELAVVAAASLTCAVALHQLTAAALTVGGFYLLARAIDAMQLMSSGPALEPGAWSSVVIARGVALLALLLPPLERYTRSAWLFDGVGALAALPPLVLQGLAYLALLAAVGWFDFARREI